METVHNYPTIAKCVTQFKIYCQKILFGLFAQSRSGIALEPSFFGLTYSEYHNPR